MILDHLKRFKKTSGNSLMEFAVTIGLMAILAATAAPKLSQMGENTKLSKSRSEIDKILRQASNFYQETAIKEGRGRFPGQDKYNLPVGGHSSVQDILDDLMNVYDENGNLTDPACSLSFAQPAGFVSRPSHGLVGQLRRPLSISFSVAQVSSPALIELITASSAASSAF